MRIRSSLSLTVLAAIFLAVITAGGQQQPHEFVRLLKDFNADPTSAGPGSFRVSNGRLFFQSWETVIDDRLSAILWEKRPLVSLPIILLALCRSIFPHPVVFASQLMIPSKGTQSSWH